MRRSGSTFAAAAIGVALLAAVAAVAAGSTASPNAPAPPSGDQLQQLSQPPQRTSIASQRVYFVMTDRYWNGDTANDRGGLTGSRDVTGYDPTDPGYFHGGDFKGLTGNCTSTTNGLARLKELGFTAIWVTPPVGQKAVQADSAAYHGYWGLDFTHVDAHLGTDQDYADFVDCAHSLGMKVYQDVVVNHTADVIQLLGGTSYRSKAYKDCKGKTFNPAKYVNGHFPCMKASNMPHQPVLPATERHAKKPDWMNNVTRYHNRGDIDFGFCGDTCFEQGDFVGLDDLFTEQPAVMRGLADVYGGWVKRYHLDGFRVDTARHVNAAFFRLWVPRIRAAAANVGVSDFEIFGEVPINDAVELSKYVRKRGLPDILDFPFQDDAAGLAAGTISTRALAARIQDDDYLRPSPGIAPTPPTFLGNHDMGRAALQIKQRSGASGDTLVRRMLLGYDLLYLLRGAPVVYYGDEVGMIGSGGDKQARQDMFPTQVSEWKTEDRAGSPPIGNGSSFDVTDNPIEVRLRELGALRDGNPALSTGATIVRSSTDKVLVVSRIDAATRREYVAAFNSGASDAHVTINTATPSSAWTPLLGSGSPASTADGSLTFDVPAIGGVLLRADSDLPVTSPPKPVVKVGRDDLSGLWRVSATVTGSAPVSVAFAIRQKTGGWKLFAADDSPPYRGFADPARFAKKERVYVVAIARSLDGQVAVSKVLASVPRPK